MSLLQVRNLSKHFGGIAAVDGIDFDVAAGELLALIGPNGAGKSTTFNMVGGQIEPSAGSITLDGKTLTGLHPRDIWRLGVGRTFQITETFASLSVVENVQMTLLSHHRRIFAGCRPASPQYRARALDLLEQVGMADQAHRPCSELAYGDVKRVELAMALANDPKLLLMDEPTAGMAATERNALMSLTKRLVVERGMAVLFTEHSMDVVFAHADRIIVLARGKAIAEGSAAEVRADPKVREVYFGSGATFEREHRPPAEEQPSIEPQPATQPEALLRVRDLNAWYGAAHILYDINLEVRRGEVVALMGRNGAGKSTTLKAIVGLLEKRRGQVEFMDRDISRKAPHQIARAGLGFVPEDRRIFADLTVQENLEVGRQAPRAWPDGGPAPAWTTDRLYALFPNLRAMQNRPGGRMSGGEQQMLTVARTLMGNPYLVLLDEPSEGVAPLIVEQMARAIIELKQQGASVLLSEQNQRFAEMVADRQYVLEKGEITGSGTV
ncbi:branched-chain amino acid ABC transporter ATP-binding protein [Bordetella genomosp. 11]|uniref:Branched-chain amino acid ABC transporter ATP-binding protein n=1 Tax=Bordetella genomosp. 11 TaxID=1416808 RepID=A0A261UN37_9BORD|nr:ATP-binding cassette domain-containing protein [Bordetella genomosp. 11]OZI63304.1 branched-chain amino acid ABC transporter ATP-binding protein [Bordetella genomosp. 11]